MMILYNMDIVASTYALKSQQHILPQYLPLLASSIHH